MISSHLLNIIVLVNLRFTIRDLKNCVEVKLVSNFNPKRLFQYKKCTTLLCQDLQQQLSPILSSHYLRTLCRFSWSEKKRWHFRSKCVTRCECRCHLPHLSPSYNPAHKRSLLGKISAGSSRHSFIHPLRQPSFLLPSFLPLLHLIVYSAVISEV